MGMAIWTAKILFYHEFATFHFSADWAEMGQSHSYLPRQFLSVPVAAQIRAIDIHSLSPSQELCLKTALAPSKVAKEAEQGGGILN